MLSKSFHRVSTHTKFILASVIQAERTTGRRDGCLQERVCRVGEREVQKGRENDRFPPPPPLNLGHLVVVRMGQKQLAATCQVKLQTQTIKVWHVLSWKMITWPLWMDNPLKADQRKSKFWSGLQRVFTCRQSRCRWLQHLIPLPLWAADHWRPLQFTVYANVAATDKQLKMATHKLEAWKYFKHFFHQSEWIPLKSRQEALKVWDCFHLLVLENAAVKQLVFVSLFMLEINPANLQQSQLVCK